MTDQMRLEVVSLSDIHWESFLVQMLEDPPMIDQVERF